MPIFKYFSFNLPTLIIVIPTSYPPTFFIYKQLIPKSYTHIHNSLQYIVCVHLFATIYVACSSQYSHFVDNFSSSLIFSINGIFFSVATNMSKACPIWVSQLYIVKIFIPFLLLDFHRVMHNLPFFIHNSLYQTKSELERRGFSFLARLFII